MIHYTLKYLRNEGEREIYTLCISQTRKINTKKVEEVVWNFYEPANNQQIRIWKYNDPNKKALYLIPVAHTTVDFNT